MTDEIIPDLLLTVIQNVWKVFFDKRFPEGSAGFLSL